MVIAVASEAGPPLLLRFSDAEVAALKAAANARATTTPDGWVSTNEALLSHMWPIVLECAEV